MLFLYAVALSVYRTVKSCRDDFVRSISPKLCEFVSPPALGRNSGPALLRHAVALRQLEYFDLEAGIRILLAPLAVVVSHNLREIALQQRPLLRTKPNLIVLLRLLD